jgi:hypothetical protein
MADTVYTTADTARRRAEDPEIQQTINAAYERFKAGAQDGTIYTDPNGRVVNFAPSSNANDGVVQSKTDKPSAGQIETTPKKEDPSSAKTVGFNSKEKYKSATEKNILHNYRSWTYNFALGPITREAISNQALLGIDVKKFAIINTAGKGTAGMGIHQGGENAKGSNMTSASQLVAGFNTNSPGRFDMFMDNVQITSLITGGSPASGTSIASNITFDVFEPYSMNGFIESLQVSSKAAGYVDYTKAVFALRVQFQGYPDTGLAAETKAEIIPQSTRYFTMKISKVDVDVNETGTRYRCEAIPFTQMGFGIANKLTSDIKVSGNTVGEVLKTFIKAVNDKVKDATKNTTDEQGYDTYEISVPKLSTVGTPQNTKSAILTSGTGTNAFQNVEMLNKVMNEELKEVTVFQMPTPADVDKTNKSRGTAAPATPVRLNPKTGTVVFGTGANIHDCIAAVIRDSAYTRDLLTVEAIEKAKKSSDGMLTYFTIRMESDLKRFDSANNKYFCNYRYVIEPYKIHFTKIPGEEIASINVEGIKAKLKREYNYIYTGKNEDVIKFNLNFNNLYYTAIPAMMGNKPSSNNKEFGASPNNGVEVRATKATSEAEGKDSKGSPTASQATDPTESNDLKQAAKAGQTQNSAYYKLAQNLHEAVLNTTALITGNLDILGDPYFLCNGGMGNQDLVLAEPMKTKDGQAPYTQGPVYVNINFRNPIDIDPATGLLKFDPNLIPYSGIYQVTTLKNSFVNGEFKQSLAILRLPGQIVGKGETVSTTKTKTRPQIGQQVVKDSAPADVLTAGFRPSDFNLATLLSRGLPSTGLPGVLSNFTNAASGIGSTVQGVLKQAAGATGALSNITSQLGASPIGGVNQLTSGVRLAASGLSAITNVTNIGATTVNAIGNTIGNVANIPNAVTGLANNMTTSLTAVPGQAVDLVNNLFNNAVGQVSGVKTLVQNTVDLGTNAAKQVGGVVDKIASLQNSGINDTNDITTKLGIDPAKLSGLGPELASQISSQLSTVASLVPENSNLGDLADQGVSFAKLTGDKIKNLFAIQAKATAPEAIDPEVASIVSSVNGSVKSLLGGAANLAALTDINSVGNPLGAVTAGLNAGLQSSQAVFGSISAVQNQVKNVIGTSLGVANNVGSLAQNSLNSFSPAGVNLGSVESNITSVNSIIQNTTKITNMASAVTTQFGSLRQASPLDKLIQSSNIQRSV